MPNLTYFTVTGAWFDVEAPLLSGSSDVPQLLPVSAFVTFTARLRPGTQIWVANVFLPVGSFATSANTSVPLAPITGRIFDGQLQTIDRANTPDIQLVANVGLTIDTTTGTPPVVTNGSPLPTLIYDVAFTQVSYADAAQKLTNFAFTAPTTGSTVDLCNPTFARLPYDPTNYPN